MSLYSITPETLARWIPLVESGSTFKGVVRSIDSKDARMTGVRLPPTEADLRRTAARHRGTPNPGCCLHLDWIRWAAGRIAAQRIDDLDAQRAWENEGGA